MQFRKQQREVMHRNWGQGNWFWDKLEPLYREIVSKAYGVTPCPPSQRSYCQEVTSTALSNFAHKIGATKSQAVHAMQTGAHIALFESLGPGLWKYGIARMAAMGDWQESFREIVDGKFTGTEG